MTLEKLNQHFELVTELHTAEEMISSLWNAASPGGQVMTGMPHTPGVKDKVGDLATEIADLETERDQLKAKVDASELELKPFFAAIPDLQTRMVMRLRFLRGMAWKEVATALGGRNSEASVKSICYRYLRDSEGLSSEACVAGMLGDAP